MIAFIAVPNAPLPRRAHVEYKGRRPETARIAASLSISPALGAGGAASSLAAAARAQGMTADRDRFVDRGRDTDRVVEFQRSVDGARRLRGPHVAPPAGRRRPVHDRPGAARRRRRRARVPDLHRPAPARAAPRDGGDARGGRRPLLVREARHRALAVAARLDGRARGRRRGEALRGRRRRRRRGRLDRRCCWWGRWEVIGDVAQRLAGAHFVSETAPRRSRRAVSLPRCLGVSRFRAVREALREATHARAYCSKRFNNLLYARRRRLHANKEAAQ